jgi:hypothetical protein
MMPSAPEVSNRVASIGGNILPVLAAANNEFASEAHKSGSPFKLIGGAQATQDAHPQAKYLR